MLQDTTARYSLKRVIWTLVVIGIVVLLATFFYEHGGVSSLVNHVRRLIEWAGPWSYVVYVAIVSLVILTPIASSSLWLLAGVLFNPLVAIGLTLIAETFGALGNYCIGKCVMDGLLLERMPKTKATVTRYAERIDPTIVFLLALAPVTTSNVTAYAAAVERMPVRIYLPAWLSGIAILCTLIIMLGHSAEKASLSQVALFTVPVIVIAAAVHYVSKRRRLMSSK